MSQVAYVLTTKKGMWYNFCPGLSVHHQAKVGKL